MFDSDTSLLQLNINYWQMIFAVGDPLCFLFSMCVTDISETDSRHIPEPLRWALSICIRGRLASGALCVHLYVLAYLAN